MDFRALPRRDLQALCKRNGVRANMTNAAMAEALAALPTVDGIGEYVKEPVAVPAPKVTAAAAAAADEQNPEKQGSPLPRGRRLTAKAVETDAGKEDEKRESAKEDAPALGVGRRGPSRRARPAPVVATSMVVPVGKEEEGEDKKDGGKEEDRRRDANKEDPPAPVVGRRAASRRARPESAAESATAEAVEEQRKKDGSPAPHARRGAVESSEPIRTGDCEEEAPALGVGRRGASRRARPAPVLAEPASKVTEEEKAPPIPCSRHVKAKSTEPMKLNDEEEDKKAATMPEEEDVPALGVGRRGASRRVRHAPAVVAAEDEPRAPIPHGQCVKVKSPEVIRLDDSEDEEKEDKKLDEKDEEAPAIGVGRRGAPAPVEAPATRRRAATSKAEAVGVTEEAVHTQATRQRKPTMKAAAAAVEKALPKATRRKAVKKTISQQDEQEKPQEAVPAPVSDVGGDNPEEPEEASGPQNREQKQKHEVVVILEDEILMQKTPAQELLVTDQDSMDHSALQGQEVGVEKCPVLLASQDDSPIMGLVSMATEQAADKDEGANFQDAEESSGSLDNKGGVFQEILDAGEEKEMVPIVQGLQVSLTEVHIEEVVTDDANRKSEIGSFNEVPHGTEETIEANTEDDLVSQNKEDINIDELQADLADGSVLVDCSGNIKLFVEEETNEVNTEDSVSLQEKGDVPVDMALPDVVAETSEANTEDDQNKEDIISDELPADLAYGSVLVDCSGNIELLVEEETNEGNTEDNVSFQKGEVPVDMAVPDIVATTILSGCSSDISCVKMEKSGDITALDEDGEETNSYAGICHADKPSEVVIGDSVSLVTATDSEVVQEEKVVVITDEVPGSTAGMHGDVEEDQFQTVFIHGDRVAAADTLPEVKMIDCEVEEEKKATIMDEQQQSMVTMDEAVDENHFETDVVRADEQKEVVNIDEVPKFTGAEGVLEEDKAAMITEEVTMDEDVDENHFETDVVHADEQKEVVTIDEVPEFTGAEGVLEEDKAAMITEEVTMDEDVDENHFETDVVHADEQKEVVNIDEVPKFTGAEGVLEEDKAAMITEEVTMDEDVDENHFETDVVHADEQKEVVTIDEVPEFTGTEGVLEEDKAAMITEEVPQSTGKMDRGDEENQFENAFVNADQVLTADSVPDLEITDCEPIEEDKATLIIDEKQQSTVTMDEDFADDHVEIDADHAVEKRKVANANEVPELTGTNDEVAEGEAVVIAEAVPQSTGTDEDVEEDQFQTFFVHAEQVVTSDGVSDLKITDCEEKTTLIIDDKQQSTVSMDEAVCGHSETDELKEVATDDKMPYLTGTVGEVVEKDEAALTTEEVPHGTGTMDDCVQKHYFEIGFVQDDELNNAVTIDNVPEITEMDGAAKNTVVCDLPQELNVAKEFNDHITQAFLDNVTESLCKSIITVEPTASVSDDITVCNNSSEKNTTELEGIQEEKLVKVAKKSVDLTKLSLGQLRTKLKEKLNAKKNKEAKRVALARVDENVCRSHSKGQQQNLNLQQH